MPFNRKALTGTALIVLAVLFVAVMLLVNVAFRGARVGPDPESSLHAVRRHEKDHRLDRRADQSLSLFLRQGHAGSAATAHVLHARARDARRDGVALGRQDQARDDRSAAVLRGRGSRDEPRSSVRSGRQGGREDLLRPRRHELDQRPVGDSVLPAGQGSVSRVRHRQADPRAQRRQEAGRRV